MADRLPGMTVLALDPATLGDRLRGATDRGEILLHFQPQVALRTGAVVAVEALARWRTASLALIPPEHFIRVAEENGTIAAFGQWVLRSACRQLSRWRADGLGPLRVAVNVSARQPLDEAFAAVVLRTLDEAGVAPTDVELELTEGQLIADLDRTAVALDALRRHGIRISIDDFGTGFSSLSRLKRLPVDAVKLDRSFIRELPHDAGNATITSAIIALAHGLGLEVIGEGVESRPQLAFLRDHGCDVIQGFLLSRPLSAESCAGWIRSYQPVDPSLVV